MANCGHCEKLMLAAVEAWRAYHDLRGDLESAHILGDAEEPFEIKQRVAEALRGRDEAIRVLNNHERTHAKGARAEQP
jgi:hypothetical protein